MLKRVREGQRVFVSGIGCGVVKYTDSAVADVLLDGQPAPRPFPHANLELVVPAGGMRCAPCGGAGVWRGNAICTSCDGWGYVLVPEARPKRDPCMDPRVGDILRFVSGPKCGRHVLVRDVAADQMVGVVYDTGARAGFTLIGWRWDTAGCTQVIGTGSDSPAHGSLELIGCKSSSEALAYLRMRLLSLRTPCLCRSQGTVVTHAGGRVTPPGSTQCIRITCATCHHAAHGAEVCGAVLMAPAEPGVARPSEPKCPDCPHLGSEHDELNGCWYDACECDRAGTGITGTSNVAPGELPLPSAPGFVVSTPLLEALGRRVRETWVAWAKEQPNPKPKWLVPYDALPEADKDADQRIGEALYVTGWAAAMRELSAAGLSSRQAVDKTAQLASDGLTTAWAYCHKPDCKRVLVVPMCGGAPVCPQHGGTHGWHPLAQAEYDKVSVPEALRGALAQWADVVARDALPGYRAALGMRTLLLTGKCSGCGEAVGRPHPPACPVLVGFVKVKHR